MSIASTVFEPVAVAQTQVGSPSWTFTGNLKHSRSDHTATLLPSGKVLVVGGLYNDVLNSAELYDSATETWSATGSLNVPRARFTATLLGNGKVLVAGGFPSWSDPSETAELYDPATGTWSLTGSMHGPRAWHSATPLPNGKVLVVGGLAESGYVAYSSLLNTAELYDPETGTWTVTGSLRTGLVAPTATLLQDGKVLLAGGCDVIYDPWTVDEEVDGALVNAELYDPSTGSWSVTGSLNAGRVFHTATLLPNGDVLVAGGILADPSLSIYNTAELYSPTKGTWSHAGKLSRRWYHTATLLTDGRVLVTGGVNHDDYFHWTVFNIAQIYDPTTSSWSTTTSLNTPRAFHTATLLSNGEVLVAGGGESGRNAELYHPTAGEKIAIPKITTATVMGKNLIVVGEDFDSGAVILINGELQKTANDDLNPQTTLIGKKAGKKVKPGDRLQVRNPNATISEEFVFTGL
jgi:N-acetylneuraminic acid mutarotase